MLNLCFIQVWPHISTRRGGIQTVSTPVHVSDHDSTCLHADQNEYKTVNKINNEVNWAILMNPLGSFQTLKWLPFLRPSFVTFPSLKNTLSISSSYFRRTSKNCMGQATCGYSLLRLYTPGGCHQRELPVLWRNFWWLQKGISPSTIYSWVFRKNQQSLERYMIDRASNSP